ncbi:MAG: M15 family metallopeptidase [Bacteroidaceae bacterium]|nr:M15 family metallopeptidase [Bacteroidaceae bacterium]
MVEVEQSPKKAASTNKQLPPKSKLELTLEKMGMLDVKKEIPGIYVDLMYTRADNFTGKVLYRNLNRAYLHPDAMAPLKRAQAILKKRRPDLSLKVYDAVRPMSVQQIMWNTVAGTSKNIYVSNPKNGGGMHNYGVAVDVTLCHATTGDTIGIDMGTQIDYLGKLAQPRYETEFLKSGKLSKEAYENRKLLREVMVEAGYKVLPSEWWHFNLVSRSVAKQKYKVIP